MKTWILSSIAVLTIVVGTVIYLTSRPLLLAGDGILLNAPNCQPNGKKVFYHKAPKEELWKFGGGVAMAFIDHSGRPNIVIDKDNLKKFSAPFQYWMLRHECQHHLLGHTKNVRQDVFSENIKLEQDADCGAIDDMVKLGLTDVHFDKLFKDMTNTEMLNTALNGNILNKKHTKNRMEHNKRCLIASRYKYLEKKNAYLAEETLK